MALSGFWTDELVYGVFLILAVSLFSAGVMCLVAGSEDNYINNKLVELEEHPDTE